MGNFINKIKQFFKEIISRLTTKKLESPKEELLESNSNISGDKVNKKEEIQDINYLKDKKEFFEIYNKVKKGKYNLNELDEEQKKKIITILNSEISLKKDRLDHEIMKLNILKADNRISEKNRIFELYNRVKNDTIDLEQIDREDLIKIRKLLLEEAKIQTEKFEDEVRALKVLSKVS